MKMKTTTNPIPKGPFDYITNENNINRNKGQKSNYAQTPFYFRNKFKSMKQEFINEK